MGYFSGDMGLRVWDLPTDDWSRTELANNWEAVDGHDHTTGKGRQVPTGGIVDGAISSIKLQDLAVSTTKLANQVVTQAKLANLSVGTAQLIDLGVTTTKLGDASVTGAKVADNSIGATKLQDGSVSNAKLADGSVQTAKILDLNVTNPKLADNAATTRVYADASVTQPKLADPAVQTENIFPAAVTSDKLDPGVVPVGTVIAWFRPSALTGLPSGWLVADGSTVLDANHDFAEATSITLPDLRNKFILGAATSGTGTGTGTPPAIGGVGGAHVVNLAHSHTANSHTHTIANDAHLHLWNDEPDGSGSFQQMRQRGNAVYGNLEFAKRQAAYVPNLNFLEEHGEDVLAPMQVINHSHGGATGTASNAGTDSQLSATTDNRPAFVGLIYLIKVKN